MSLKNKILIIFFAMNMFMMQSLQAMELATLAKFGVAIMPAAALFLYKLKNEFFIAKRVEAKVDVVDGKVTALDKKVDEKVKKLHEELAGIVGQLQAFDAKLNIMQQTMSAGFSEAKDAYEVLKSDLESQLQEVEQKLITQFGEQSEALRQNIQSMIETVRKELSERMNQLDAKIAQLATKDDVKETVNKALQQTNERLGRIEAGQNRQAQLFEDAIQRIEAGMKEGNREIVHTMQGLPAMFALSGYMVRPSIQGPAQQPKSQPRLIGNVNN